MTKKIKVIHIHTDPKFIFTINKYSEEIFDNRLVYFGDIDKLQNRYKRYLVDLPINNKKRYAKLKQECLKANIIMLYNLESFGIKLALDLPLHIKIIWRFFGWELYSKHPKLIYSEKSLKTWKPTSSKMSIINRVKRRVWEIIYGNNSFEKAINRIDYFKGLMDSEYDLLLSLGYKLPPFV